MVDKFAGGGVGIHLAGRHSMNELVDIFRSGVFKQLLQQRVTQDHAQRSGCPESLSQLTITTLL